MIHLGLLLECAAKMYEINQIMIGIKFHIGCCQSENTYRNDVALFVNLPMLIYYARICNFNFTKPYFFIKRENQGNVG